MQVKGISIRSILKAVESVAGPEGLEAVKVRLSPTLRTLVQGAVLQNAFYPAAYSAEIHLAIRDALGAGSWDMNRRVGAEAARLDFGGVYRVFLRMMDYQATLDRLQAAWSQYNSQGTLEWSERSRTRAVATIRNVPGFNEGQWHSIAGRTEAILMLAGAQRATATLHTVPDGCTIQVDWTP